MTRILDDGADYVQLPLDASGKLSAFIKTNIGDVGVELYLPTAALIDEDGNTIDNDWWRGINQVATADEQTHEMLEVITLLLSEMSYALNLIVAETRGGRQEMEVQSVGHTTFNTTMLKSTSS